ncbi:MAG: RpiB/LacA/LacB family sugar-phosphate isomerase [Candidatus Sungbacteria bacterium]|uniref:RpiB/LacA/LacB family sugar-phosphate isomerase n=1 Tax=Candidatus Sungiibacteriota bacterium TaxID=2750080 RepID=A0A931WPI5_9BACT|nr:RpiB/LacA/LacB family sugar-phosphate isomerase [Candidatus Sungbacteria bacterium]
MIYLGADHRGFALKESLKAWLLEIGYDVKDVGAAELDVADDYPDFAVAAVEALAKDMDHGKAIIVCGSGHGMDMIANKYKGVRAALCFNISVAKQSREHENANVLVLAADWIKEHDALEIVKVWLATEYGGAERNNRRLGKMKEVEEKNFQ